MENGTGVQLRLRRISRQAMPNMPSMAEDGSGTASAFRDAGKRSVLGSGEDVGTVFSVSRESRESSSFPESATASSPAASVPPVGLPVRRNRRLLVV